MTELILPWPPRVLSPNARVHWAVRSKAAKLYREACFVLARKAGWTRAPEGRLHLWIDFYPPDRRHRDDDNCLSAFKHGRDGIADALRVDDKVFVSHPLVKSEIGGIVKVRMTGGPQ